MSDVGPSRVALVTGGSRGVGKAISLALADEGFSVGVVARSEPDLDETRRELEGRGAAAAAFVADVVDPSAVERAVRAIEGELGPITTLVNNAGTALAIGPLWEVEPQAWLTDVETSLHGTFNACRSVVPGMIARRRGRILNLSSYAALRPAPYDTAYASAKAAVATLTEGLAASLDDYGIKVFAITPGFVRTDLTAHLAESPEGRRWFPELGDRVPLDPDGCARLAVSLATGKGDVLNGRFLHALDDVDRLVREFEAIERDSLYLMRLRQLP
jgi:NAD(P)-dependent dehydrogenase (short-subunit alcohol dehydrogenase family)